MCVLNIISYQLLLPVRIFTKDDEKLRGADLLNIGKETALNNILRCVVGSVVDSL